MGAEIDNLEIKIEAEASKAVKQLSKLQQSLKELSSILSGINISDSLSLGLEKSTKSNQAMKTLDNLEKTFGTTKNSAEKLQKAFADVGKGFKFSGNSKQLQKEIEKTERLLDRLWAKEDKLKTIGASENTQGWKSLQYDIAQTLNKLDVLREKEKELASIDPLENVKVTHHLFPDEVFQSFDELHDRLQELSNQAPDTKEDVEDIADSFKNAAKQAEKLNEATKKLKFSSADNNTSSSAKSMENARKSLRERLFGESEVPTEEFKKLSSEIEKAERHLENLYTRQERMEFQGVKKGSSSFRGLSYDINKAEKELENLNKAMDTLKSGGGAYKKAELPVMNTKSAAAGIQKLSKSLKKLSSITLKTFGKLGNDAGNATKRIFGLSNAADHSRMSLARMLGTSLMFSGVFRGIGLVTDGVTVGFENLAQYSETTNASISLLMSALLRLKNAFAVAFGPILDVAAPILGRFVNMLSDTLNAVGQFFSALTGKQYAAQAVAVQQDFAAGLVGTSKNADNATDSVGDLSGATKKLAKNLSILGFDEINKLNEAAENMSDAVSGGNNGKITLPSTDLLPADMFQTVPIEKSISDFANRIRKAFASGDWKGIGKILASKINTGLQCIYDAINWKKVGPKVTKFTTAFTEAFNSLVDNVNWGLMGRTLGTGINTTVNTLNQSIEKIRWKNLGKKFSTGINGIVLEVDWGNLGNLLGNNFMISWNILYGFVKNLNYGEIGVALGKSVNGIFEKVDFVTIGTVFAEGFNGIFDTLRNFNITVEWDNISTKLSNGLNKMIHTIKWSEAGQVLSGFVENFLKTIWGVAENTDWESLGRGIGEFLSSIDWGTNLGLAVDAIVTAFGGLLDGLEGSGTAGKIAVWLTKAFLAVQVAGPVLGLVNNLTKAITGDTAYQKLYGAFKVLFGKAATDSATSLIPLGDNLSQTLGRFSDLSNSVWGTTFILGNFDQAIKNTKTSADGARYSTLVTALMELRDSGELTDKKFNDFYSTLGAAQTKSVPFSDALVYVEDELKNAGIKTEDFEKVLSDTLDRLGVSAPEKAKIIGSGIGNGTAKGIEESKQVVQKASEGLGSSIVTWVKNILGIHSPSTVMCGIGQNVVIGLGNGINDKAGTALDAMKRLGDKLKGSLDGSLRNIESSTDRSMNNLGRSFDSAEQRAYSASSNIVNAFSNIHIPLPHIDVGWDNWNVGTLSFSVPRFNLNWYANGGFPNAGELFMANEAGPELVGKMGNRNVVANNKQITDGIKAAVVEGMTEVMMVASAGQNDDKAYILNVTVKTEDNEVLARAVEKGKLKRDTRYNPCPAY